MACVGGPSWKLLVAYVYGLRDCSRCVFLYLHLSYMILCHLIITSKSSSAFSLLTVIDLDRMEVSLNHG